MQKKIKKFIRDKGVYVAMLMIVAGCISIPLLFWFASVIVIGIGSIFFIFFGCGLLGLFQWKYVKDHIEMAYNQFAMYAFIGFGMCLLNFILLLNYAIGISEHTETYTISRKGYYNEIIIGGDIQNRALERNLNTYIGEHMDKTSFEVNKVTITFETGLFGFDMIRNCEFN
ncbi:MAG: hypothetical protein V4511_14730 [Bacteroidota bacterium]